MAPGSITLFGALGLAILAPEAGRAACDLERGERVHVAEVIDGDTVALEEGDEVRLVGTQAPKLPLGRRGFTEWPLADEAKAALEALSLGRTVELRYGGERMDRHGRRLAHIFVEENDGPVWVQGSMIDQGLARVYSFPDNRACVEELLAREREARAARRGIWKDPYYVIRNAADEAELEALEDTFQLVEGEVAEVAMVGGRVYLNFGHNYREDFTVTIDPRDTRHFADRGQEMRALEGRHIRVRGWIAIINGPTIEVSHPEQIELVDMVNSQ